MQLQYRTGKSVMVEGSQVNRHFLIFRLSPSEGQQKLNLRVMFS
jgi:hypothetical protein